MKKDKQTGSDSYFVFYTDKKDNGYFKSFKTEDETKDFLSRGLSMQADIGFIIKGSRLYPIVEVGKLSSFAPDNEDLLFLADPSDHSINGLVRRLDKLKEQEIIVRSELNGLG